MNYGELRTLFKGILDRDDCDDNLADTFIGLGLRRVSRVLRTQLQRRTLVVAVDGDYLGYVAIPSDYLGIIEVLVNGVPVQRLTESQKETEAGYYFRGISIFFNVEMTEGSEIRLIYYADFDYVGDDITTGYSLVVPDLVVYASLGHAASYFIDEREAGFEQRFDVLLREVQMMNDIDALIGHHITPYGGGVA